MNAEYKSTCTAGHPRYGAPAGCAHCDAHGDPPARPVLLETKEHGSAVAYLEDDTAAERPNGWPELRP